MANENIITKEDVINKFSKNLEEYYQIEINSPMNENLTEMLRTAIDEANLIKNHTMLKIMEVLKEKIEEAFNDMTTIYAPELTGDGKDKLAKKIQRYGKGTLGYISDKRNEAIKTFEELLSNFSA